MHYTLHQLQIFRHIAELQSITKASEVLNLTQPAVSIQLKNFQDQFPLPLTEVVGRRLYITDFGREIAEASKKILDEVDAINHRVLAFSGQLAGRLKLSVASTGKYVMPYFLTDFMKLHPGVELIMDVTNKARVVESLENNEVDFALVSVLPNKLKVDVVPLMDNSLYLVASGRFNLPPNISRRTIFERYPLIYREQGSATRNAMEEYIAKYELGVRNKIELTSNEAVKQAVVADLGCSIMPVIGIGNELNNGSLKIIPVRGLPIHTEWNIVWLSSKKLSPVATAYLDFLKKEKNRIIQEHFAWVRNVNE